jgi:hypothetical protein
MLSRNIQLLTNCCALGDDLSIHLEHWQLAEGHSRLQIPITPLILGHTLVLPVKDSKDSKGLSVPSAEQGTQYLEGSSQHVPPCLKQSLQ